MKALGVAIALGAMTSVVAAQGLPLPASAPPSEDLSEALARFAPDIYQDVDDSQASSDLLTAMDFDGDVDMSNNWESLEGRSFDDLLKAGVIYTWATRTATHDFLGYGFYHPRDWHDPHGRVVSFGRRLLGKGTDEHENDLEGILLVVDRSRDEPVLMVTQAHNQFWQYGDDADWDERRDGDRPRSRKREDLDGPIRRDPVTGRVQVFVEAEGHGVYGSPRKNKFDAATGDGVLYSHGGSRLTRSREGAHAVGYGLESIAPWWDRFQEVPEGEANATFTRKDGKVAFSGDTRDRDSANPPWGWRDADYPDAVNAQFFGAPQEFVNWSFEPTAPYSRRAISHTIPAAAGATRAPAVEAPRCGVRPQRRGAAGALGRRVR